MDAYEWVISYLIPSFNLSEWRCHKFQQGLNARQAEHPPIILSVSIVRYAVKKYKSHRKVGAGNMIDIHILSNEA